VRGQSRLSSFVESLVNVAIGYGFAFVTQLVVFPLFNIRVSLGENVAIGAIFTVVSIVRSYAVRRLFNLLHIRAT
jgi:hypothetical protein